MPFFFFFFFLFFRARAFDRFLRQTMRDQSCAQACPLCGTRAIVVLVLLPCFSATVSALYNAFDIHFAAFCCISAGDTSMREVTKARAFFLLFLAYCLSILFIRTLRASTPRH